MQSFRSLHPMKCWASGPSAGRWQQFCSCISSTTPRAAWSGHEPWQGDSRPRKNVTDHCPRHAASSTPKQCHQQVSADVPGLIIVGPHLVCLQRGGHHSRTQQHGCACLPTVQTTCCDVLWLLLVGRWLVNYCPGGFVYKVVDKWYIKVKRSSASLSLANAATPVHSSVSAAQILVKITHVAVLQQTRCTAAAAAHVFQLQQWHRTCHPDQL
jgi:hypothetical protein